VYYFTISFLTVIWAIVAFIDNNIMNILSGNTGTGVGEDNQKNLFKSVHRFFADTLRLF
jgi:hypothetical protein